MASKEMTYEQAVHAMQSGVAVDQGYGSTDGQPKHLRVGINAEMATMQSDPEWWTVRELAARWRCSGETIRRRILAGDIKAMRGCGGHRIHQSEVSRHESGAKTSTRRMPAGLPPVQDELGLYAARD